MGGRWGTPFQTESVGDCHWLLPAGPVGPGPWLGRWVLLLREECGTLPVWWLLGALEGHAQGWQMGDAAHNKTPTTAWLVPA